MPACRLNFTDRFRMPLVRVAARLQHRDGEIARILAECIVTTLAAVDAQGRAAGEQLADGRPFDCNGRTFRATPEAVAFLTATDGVLKLYSFVHDVLTSDPGLADLLPLLKISPRPKLNGW